jgi:hypothetical protein
MENLKIEVEETKTYKQRMKSILIWGFPPIIAFSVYLYFMPSPNRSSDAEATLLSLFICTLFSSVLFLFSDALCAYHISYLEIKENSVHIIYKKRDENLELDDVLERFKFNYCPRYRVPAFIKIEYNGMLAIRQHRVWAWKHSGFFDQTKEYLENHKLLYRTWSML